MNSFKNFKSIWTRCKTEVLRHYESYLPIVVYSTTGIGIITGIVNYSTMDPKPHTIADNILIASIDIVTNATTGMMIGLSYPISIPTIVGYNIHKQITKRHKLNNNSSNSSNSN